jgi:CheY-like chemotaxis protein
MKRPRLLCVDDDPGMRGFYAALLGNHGYEVVVASSGRQALTILRNDPKKIDAVITDYDMPEMNGPQLAAALKHMQPGLPIMMVSGSQPTLEEAPHFVDAALAKGAPIQIILNEIELLLASARVDGMVATSGSRFESDFSGRSDALIHRIEGAPLGSPYSIPVV